MHPVRNVKKKLGPWHTEKHQNNFPVFHEAASFIFAEANARYPSRHLFSLSLG